MRCGDLRDAAARALERRWPRRDRAARRRPGTRAPPDRDSARRTAGAATPPSSAPSCASIPRRQNSTLRGKFGARSTRDSSTRAESDLGAEAARVGLERGDRVQHHQPVVDVVAPVPVRARRTDAQQTAGHLGALDQPAEQEESPGVAPRHGLGRRARDELAARAHGGRTRAGAPRAPLRGLRRAGRDRSSSAPPRALSRGARARCARSPSRARSRPRSSSSWLSSSTRNCTSASAVTFRCRLRKAPESCSASSTSCSAIGASLPPPSSRPW